MDGWWQHADLDSGGCTWAGGGVEKSVILTPIKMLTLEAGLWMQMCCMCGCIAYGHVVYGEPRMG